MIYLDHQASTPAHPLAAAAIVSAMADFVANPHSTDHAAGWAAADAIEIARGDIANAINAEPDEIVFTSGATEANNIALLGVGARPGKRNRIVASAIEHKAVLGPARELQHRGFELVIAPVTPDGMVDMDQLAMLIDDRTLLVSCMAVNNEIGTVQPVERVAELCRKAGALLHVDAAQALAWSAADVLAFDADLMSLSGHKAGGPKGIGALFVRREVRATLHPVYHGGEQEGGLRPGSLPTPLCVGFGVACRHLPPAPEVAAWRGRTMRFEASLRAAIPGFSLNGDGQVRHPGALSLIFPDIDAEQLTVRLQPDIALSRGSACTSGIPEPSHVLQAIGLDQHACDNTVRIGVGRFSSDHELEMALEAIISAAKALSGRKTVSRPLIPQARA